jgi:hypothetical protein
MGSRIGSRRIARLAPFASLLALAACSGVIGIEDLNSGPRPGSAGASGNGGDTSTAGDGVGPNGGTNATSGSTGKAGNSSGGSSVIGEGGEAGIIEGGAGPSGGSGTVGGSGGATGGTAVHGHVIDYWGHVISDAPVQVGDQLVTTDAQGAFTIDDAPATYDVGLTVDFSGSGPRETYGWAFLGLTRRDPTLQVYAGLPSQDGNIQINPTNATETATRTLTVALGGPDGAEQFTDVDGAIQTDTSWRGPGTTQERAHGLFWQFDATSELPTSYLGYDSVLVALTTTTDVAMIPLNLKATATIPSGNITGTVTPAANTSRENDVFLRFTSGASIELASDTKGPNTFSYLVPTIANSGVTLAAVEGDAFFGSYAVAHKDGLAAGATGVTAAIPNPSKPISPADGAGAVDSSTQFTFTAGTGNSGPFLISMIDEGFYQGLYVVTASKTFKVPNVPGGPYAFASGDKYLWRVETHGAFASMDAMAGPQGFMDEFSGDDSEPLGPNNTNGAFTISVSNEFTAK